MIGVFDSGAGGLTVVRALRALAPQADVLYVADTANMPYGEKSKEELVWLTERLIGFLRTRGATTIVSACNSVSSSVIRPMFDLYGVGASDIVEMVGPAIKELRRRSVREAAVVATPATVRSGMYEMAAAAEGVRVRSFACTELARSVEENAPPAVIAEIVRNALAGIPTSLRTVLLGCTHYPIVQGFFEAVAKETGQEREFIDPAAAVAAAAIRRHGAEGGGRCAVLRTKPSSEFDRHVGRLLGSGVDSVEAIRL